MSNATLPAQADRQTTQVQRRDDSPGAQLRQMIESRKAEIARVLPSHLNADRLVKIATVAITKNERLLECTQISVMQSVMTAAQLGLDVGGALGSAYLVPFKRNKKNDRGAWESFYECQLVIGYRGLIDLARRSGQIVSIEARVVYANDDFSVEYGLEGSGTKLVHRPALDKDPGAFRLVYAVAKLKDGGTQFELMTKAQVDKIRASSMAKDAAPWTDHYDEMARKTVVKRLSKYLPIAVELADALSADNRSEFGNEDGVPTTVSQPTGAAALNNHLSAPQSGPALPSPDESKADPEPEQPKRLSDIIYAADSQDVQTMALAEVIAYEMLTSDLAAVEPERAKLAIAKSKDAMPGIVPNSAQGKRLRAEWLNAVAEYRLDLDSGMIRKAGAA